MVKRRGIARSAPLTKLCKASFGTADGVPDGFVPVGESGPPDLDVSYIDQHQSKTMYCALDA